MHRHLIPLTTLVTAGTAIAMVMFTDLTVMASDPAAVGRPVPVTVSPSRPAGTPTVVPATPAPPRPETTPAKPTSPAKPAVTIVAGPGSRGATVSTIQDWLARMRWFDREPTGFYGTLTTQAVRGFQAKHGLTVTGTVDKATYVHLKGHAASLPERDFAPAAAPGASGTLDPRCLTGARVMCIDKTVQRLYYVESGRVLDSFSTRTGRPGLETREGSFSVFLKSPKWWSTLYDVWMPYSMFFSGGQAVHYSEEFATSGYGAGSHGCVNLRDMDGIAWMYGKVQVGDRVVVYRS